MQWLDAGSRWHATVAKKTETIACSAAGLVKANASTGYYRRERVALRPTSAMHLAA